jgi:hypothetical protein
MAKAAATMATIAPVIQNDVSGGNANIDNVETIKPTRMANFQLSGAVVKSVGGGAVVIGVIKQSLLGFGHISPLPLVGRVRVGVAQEPNVTLLFGKTISLLATPTPALPTRGREK